MAPLNIDDYLPSEIFNHIFKYLNYIDLKNVKITSKKWKSHVLALYRTHEQTKYKVAINNSIILHGCSVNSPKDCNCKSTKVRLLGKYSYEIAPLPRCLDGHSIIINRNDELMVLGGFKFSHFHEMFQECLVYKEKKWVHHSTLNGPKYFSITVNMPNGIYIFGKTAYNKDSGASAEFLGNGEHQWKELDIDISSHGLQLSDGVAISDEEIIFTGGIKRGHSDGIRTFNVKTNTWTNDGKLFTARWLHKSFVFNDKVIICGGMNFHFIDVIPGIQREDLSSTEIISIHSKEVRKAGNLNQARCGHGMGILVIEGVPTLAAFGGIYLEGEVPVRLSSVELWDDANECWIMSEMKLPGPGYTFASYSSVVNNS